jgi:hypothetical protein
VSIGIAYPLYYLVGSYVNDAKIYALDIENKKLSAEASKYKKIIGEKLKEIEVLDGQINKLSTIYSAKTKTLSSIYDKKVNYKLKSELLHIFSNELHKYDVQVNRIYSNNDTFWLDLTSENDRDITEFIKYISQKHFDSIKYIDIKKIAKDANNSDYNGLLKVELR